MHRLLAAAAAFLAALLLDPAQALAWGPGVHMAVGNLVLENMNALAPLVQRVLSVHPEAFLYGCLSADIFIGKGCSAKPAHSHNWNTGFRLLDGARGEEMRSYAYGYLSHLAADVAAHNFFVPNNLSRTPLNGKISHVYLEMQADRRVNWCRRQARGLFNPSNRRADLSLLTAVKKRVKRRGVAFLLKKQLFRGSIDVGRAKSWERGLALAGERPRLTLDTADLEQMLDLSAGLVFDLLAELDDSPVVAFDPIGSSNLATARRILRRRLRQPAIAPSPLFPVPEALRSLETASPARITRA